MDEYEKNTREFLSQTFLGIQEGAPLTGYERRRLHGIRLRAPAGSDRRLLAMVLISWSETIVDDKAASGTEGASRGHSAR